MDLTNEWMEGARTPEYNPLCSLPDVDLPYIPEYAGSRSEVLINESRSAHLFRSSMIR